MLGKKLCVFKLITVTSMMMTMWKLFEDVRRRTTVVKVQVTECPAVDCPDQ